MPCGWEGNRRSGIALPMRRRLRWFIHLRAHGLSKGDEYPAYTPHVYKLSTLSLCRRNCLVRYNGDTTTVSNIRRG